MQIYNYILYTTFGLLPSLAWLFYYLQKDLHPEPKKTISKVFLWGAFATVPVILLELGFSEALASLQYVATLYNPDISGYVGIIFPFVKWFLVIAFIEEFFKYLVVRFAVLKTGVIDEPLDIMLYMVVASLGFAGLENILYLFSPINSFLSFDQIIKVTITISFFRFIGATLLHTLCSALVGYFLALGFTKDKNGPRFLWVGLLFATLLHGLFNISIMTLQSPFNFLVPIGIILVLVMFMIYDFNSIKKMKGICKLK